jgi:ATP-dependent protease ClpP protease subunit
MRYIALLTLLLACTACVPSQIETSLSYSNISIGSHIDEVTEILGGPKKTQRHQNYTVYNYCTLGSMDEMYEIAFRDSRVGYIRRYINTSNGPCHRFFEPVNWISVKSTFTTGTKGWNREEYKIDGLLIVTEAKQQSPQSCYTGNIHRITLKGMIGPDSSYAIEKLIKNSEPCSDINGNILNPVEVQLESGGGLIDDGYMLGRTLKKFRATTIVENDKTCASSCAVAFLGGERRIVEDNGTVLFHAPYYDRLNALGESDPNCEVEESVLNDMQSYFTEMTTPDISERLIERTMWYCSADNGWTVTGGNAAKLYGIATE